MKWTKKLNIKNIFSSFFSVFNLHFDANIWGVCFPYLLQEIFKLWFMEFDSKFHIKFGPHKLMFVKI